MVSLKERDRREEEEGREKDVLVEIISPCATTSSVIPGEII